MKILAIDTSTEACSAAILNGDVMMEESQIAPQQHAELILGMVDTVLERAELTLADLDVIAYGQGPGSFIGVRIAASVVQGIAYAADLPVVPVSSLAAMAQGYLDHDHLLVAIDARMKEVYWGVYVRNPQGRVSNVGGESVLAPNKVKWPKTLLENNASWCGIGTGWDAYRDILSATIKVDNLQSQVFPYASHIARLALHQYSQGEFCSAFEALPVYLRDKVAEKSASKAQSIKKS